MRHRMTTLTTTLIATALTCAWLALAAFPSGASACVELSCGHGQTPQSQPVIVHETIAAHTNSNDTLPLALASGALLIALAGTGCLIVRATKNRRQPARHSS
jgi:hypothetical protein